MIKLPKQNLCINQGQTTFTDRTHAGDLLVPLIEDLLDRKPELAFGVVVGVPRGGVVVANQVARKLNFPLDIMVTGKIMAPGRDDIVIGAVTERGRTFINQPLVNALKLDLDSVNQEVAKVKHEIAETASGYRKIIPSSDFSEKTVFIIDDNVITGATMFATLRGLWAERPASIVVALPVAPASTLVALSDFADEVIALAAPETLDGGIDTFYKDLEDVTAERVLQILQS